MIQKKNSSGDSCTPSLTSYQLNESAGKKCPRLRLSKWKLQIIKGKGDFPDVFAFLITYDLPHSENAFQLKSNHPLDNRCIPLPHQNLTALYYMGTSCPYRTTRTFETPHNMDLLKLVYLGPLPLVNRQTDRLT